MSKLENEHVWCPVDFVIHVIGSRWTIPIVRYLNSGPKRPSELSKLLNGISPKTLTQRLRELETWGLVEREAFQEIPPRVTYTLSDRGRDLVFVMEALRDLGESWQRNLDIQVPPAMKEQCSHCFEYIPSDSANAANDEQEMT